MAKAEPAIPLVPRTPVRLEAAGAAIHGEWVEPEGAPAETALVLLHEGLGSTGFWKDLPEVLAARHGLRVFLYDRRGYGRSDPEPLPRPLDYLDRMALLELPAVLDAAGIGRAILLGHSDGGTIALLAAAAFPERVEAVVAIAAHVFVEEATVAGIRAAVEAFEAGELRRRLERFHGARTEAVFRAWAETWLDPRFRAWNVEDRLGRVRCPLLVLQGAADEYATPAQVDAIARGVRGPVRRVLLPGADHVPHHRARAATLAAIDGFLDQLRTGAFGEEEACRSGANGPW
ncbi:MAG: alpha/beta hydrolase [Geminicoccaceae bacterium]|nr:alpha/beta hydrolase [Geminicoccaceae bacterium]MCX8100590.1 alpha/beta hydrolase [Geminicoccaceae bacterium]MDW8369297.1 alpha/beta hydrolase [Geminicoccaceae bacterium]